MREIEMKFKLSEDVSRNEVLERFGFAGVESKRQIDTVYLLPEQMNKPIVEGSKVLRVRDIVDSSDNVTKSFITLKIRQSNSLDATELETEVADGRTAKKMFDEMGWLRNVVVDKIRTEACFEEYTVCVDEVKRLGLFIELEVLTDDQADIEGIQQGMKKLLNNLGLAGEIWTTPYDTSIKNLEKQ